METVNTLFWGLVPTNMHASTFNLITRSKISDSSDWVELSNSVYKIWNMYSSIIFVAHNLSENEKKKIGIKELKKKQNKRHKYYH